MWGYTCDVVAASFSWDAAPRKWQYLSRALMFRVEAAESRDRSGEAPTRQAGRVERWWYVDSAERWGGDGGGSSDEVGTSRSLNTGGAAKAKTTFINQYDMVHVLRKDRRGMHQLKPLFGP